jgi:hypothetical protein
MKISFLAFCLFLFYTVNGQFVEPKIGKIEMTDLAMTKYDKDTTAGALFLFDKGDSKFILSPEKSFQYLYSRHCQIKIFKKSAFSIAEIRLKLYRSGKKSEELRELKAVTYNLVNGKVVKTKLDNDNIYKTSADNYLIESFAFPEVKEGSIIELSYSITSDFLYDFRGWTFQGDYPARWSQYQWEIPEYYQYRQLSKGYLRFDIDKRDQGNTVFNVTLNSEAESGFGNRTAPTVENIRVITARGILAVKDVPAFISEPNIDCEDNYKQSIEFELSSVEFPGSRPTEYTQTWESVNKQMIEDEDFGELLVKNGFVKDTVAALINNKSKDIEKAQSIYNYLQKSMKWNGTYSIWSMDGLKKPFNDHTGTSCEMNLLLTLMLQSAGLNASPVIFSTRDNGIAVSYSPTISKFNSVCSMVKIDGNVLLLDVTSKYCPFGLLPANDLNGKGRVVNRQSGDWVDMAASGKYTVNKSYSIDISADGGMAGSISGTYDGYAGLAYRNTLESEKSTADYIKKIQENTKGLTINKYSITDQENIYKPVSDTLQTEITENSELIGDKIMFRPLLFEGMDKNRYTLEDRKYPVNYSYPISDQYTFSYTIPEGYTVESLPPSVSLKMPDSSVSVSYTIKKADNKIRLEYSFNVNKILFLPDQYKALKDFYDQVVKKHAEQVILKKVS